MRALHRLSFRLSQIERGELIKAFAMAGLYFLVISTIGILRPIRNAFALDGLADTQYYKVYMVSAAVILFVIPYNRLANRIPWRSLIPGVALVFALGLVVFRTLYVEQSTAIGMAFYGFYDMYAAVMVTQFFMATQLFFTTRDAKRLYPFAIAGGSIGAVVGSAITGFFGEIVGLPNLLLVAAGIVVVFALTIPLVWASQARADSRPPRSQEELTAGEFITIFRNKHVQLIAGAVLLTVLVKTLVDYQFNEITRETFVTRDAVGAFQGKFFAATQWLPIVVLATLRPLLYRWGVGLVVLILPVVLLSANLALALTWSIVAAVVAKAGDSSFRYSAERAGREILYVPLPEDIKLKAKAYIDMAVEKGLGKLLSGFLIFAVLFVIDYRMVGYFGVALGAIWVAVAVAVRAEYVRTLARSIQGRFASFDGIFASMADASTMPVVQGALRGDDARGIAFALELVDQADAASARHLVDDLHGLLSNSSPHIRERALAALVSFPDDVDAQRVQDLVEDPDERVRVAAVRALCRVGKSDPEHVLKSLLDSDERSVRLAALACIGEREVEPCRSGVVSGAYVDQLIAEAQRDGVDARVELALALLALGDDPRVPDALGPLLRDPQPRVAEAALRTAGHLGQREFFPRLIAALGSASTREAAREALVILGERVEGMLSDYLADPSAGRAVRRNIPGVLARIPAQGTVDDLLRFLASRPADRLLRYRTLKALNSLRVRNPDLKFAAEPVMQALAGEVESGARYASADLAFGRLDLAGPAMELLRRSLSDAWSSGRESVFRLLHLLYPPKEIYRAYMTIEGGSSAARANAFEWLERTVGHHLFVRMVPAIQEGAGRGSHRELREVLTDLMGGDDVWLASCATWAAFELRDPWVREELQRARRSGSTELSYLAERALARLDSEDQGTQPESSEMNLIEKVFLLQQVDLLSDARAEELAQLASIAEEIEVKPGSVLLRQDEPTEAMYVVIRGAVELRRADEQVLTAQEGTAFGTWALIDESPSVVEATVVKTSELLRITREDFYDLLADHRELVRGLLKGLARRVRSLVK
ncbi:MAG: cyclic nucleotide-binding domain-containing protein [Gemmatimonadota bacterium]|nr:MAG: cyclic nucleotide-binding domain-containing protein [Gemmatimonadota bacterium]